ncbi:FusA-like translation elongation factor [Encephalitozoon intestinalis ATCC 50506]|uniref:FusA-like translation elongation factor n=1 Tax=Encephalitozoon intestinalis (strain ATCC 50506) TaxID=876142 RepID=E0S9E2_ENCIT|nr:FusA-like translation elongation factor [Encephalitozoon intestinalis ATCC 50506]ADM12206.2 FusA-like translation elongation factor [Encephalitozoon intestinalis ATCC 50506]UTX46013.1 ribosome-releasing factor 2-like protein [Encephalitozoon intestinalis]
MEGKSDVEIIEEYTELLGSHESLYRRKTLLAGVEERDLSYFNFIGQNKCRKTVVGLFGFGGAGKTSLVKLLGSRSTIQATRECLSTETPYEAERRCTIHVHPTTVFLQRKNGISHIMTLLDTPGHADLIPETIKTLEQVDTVVMVLDICRDLSLQYELLFGAIEASKKPLIVVFNKMDLIGKEGIAVAASRIKYLRDIIEAYLNPRCWFVSSFKESKLSKLDTTIGRLIEEYVDDFDSFIERIISKEPITHGDRDKMECLTGFLWVGGVLLCSLVPKTDIGVGFQVEVYGTTLTIERLYLPFPGCLVKTQQIQSKIGVLAKFPEDMLQKVVIPGFQRDPRLMKEVLKRKGVEYGNPEFLEVEDPLVRVQVSPDNEDHFSLGTWKLRLMYPSLKIDGKILYGDGELFMDTVLYDLRNSLGIKFEVLSVSSNLKEIFGVSFTEEVDTGRGLVVVKGGPTRTMGKIHDFGAVEKRILDRGLLAKDPFVHSYLEVSPVSEEVELECLKRLENSVIGHVSLLEPLYLVEIVYTSDSEDLVNEVITSSFGEIISRKPSPFNELKNILCYIPVPESFGFETDLRVYSCSRADCVKIPFYWRPVADKDRTHRLARFIRKAKRPEP